ncbi:hypothetical protein V6Z12_D04G124800 [Gossypium hirsutum]
MVSLRLKTLSSLYADDVDVPQVQHYRLFLKEHVVFKEVLWIIKELDKCGCSFRPKENLR